MGKMHACCLTLISGGNVVVERIIFLPVLFSAFVTS